MAEHPVVERQKGGMTWLTMKNMFRPFFRVEKNLGQGTAGRHPPARSETWR